MRTWPALKVGRPDSPDGLDLLHAAFLDYRIAAIDDTSPDGLQVYFNRVLTPLYVKTVVQAAKSAAWRAR